MFSLSPLALITEFEPLKPNREQTELRDPKKSLTKISHFASESGDLNFSRCSEGGF